MKFWYGVVLGLALGAAGTWAAMARPWRGEPTVAAAEAIDAGPAEPTKKAGKKKRRPGGRRGAAGGDATGDEGWDEPPPPVLSAADRASVTRGPAIALPRRSLDMASGDDARPLDAGEINDVIRRSSGPVLACIEQAREGAELRGTIQLEMLVGGDGRVGKVRVTAPKWLVDHGFADCASAAARRWTFPATGAPTVVDAPYHID